MKKILLNCFFLLMIASNADGQIKLKKIDDLPKKLSETSGLVLYDNKYLITHNDGGNGKDLFVLNTKGKLLKKIEVSDAKNKDWEDLTVDNIGQLYIGDFGNNENKREKCHIYILPNGFIEQEKVPAQKITFRYEDQEKYPPKKKDWNYDCEAFFWKDGYLYLFTKCRTKPYTGESRIYRLSAAPGKQIAEYIGSINLSKTGWRFSSVTSVDYNPKTGNIALLTYSRLYILSGFKEGDLSKGKLKSYALPVIKQREAICFAGRGKLYMTDEYKKGLGGGNLYQIQMKANTK